MKYYKYCGKGLHTASSFCPYCMKSQIAKQSAAMQQKKSKNIRYRFLEAGLLLLLCATIAVLCLLVWGKEPAETSLPSDSAIDTVKSSAATWTEPAQSTTAAATASVDAAASSATDFMENANAAETAAASEAEASALSIGDYITAGKTRSQIQGYGGYTDIGGTILTIESITDQTITFSIVQYSDSGYAADTVSAKQITAQWVKNTAAFEFCDDTLDGKGYGTLSYENGTIHIETRSNTNHPTKLVLNEDLVGT